MNCFIRSFALITADRFVTRRGTIPHPGTELTDIPRESVYPEPYRHFGKMGAVEKLFFSAVSLALREFTLPRASGMVLSVPQGSLETDRAYMNSLRSGFPSPALFAATLPSAAAAELAIPFDIHGPNRIFPESDNGTALLNGLFLIQRNTPAVIAAAADLNAGYAAAVILQAERSDFSLTFTAGKNQNCNSEPLLRSLIAQLSGENHITPLTTANGTFLLSEVPNE